MTPPRFLLDEHVPQAIQSQLLRKTENGQGKTEGGKGRMDEGGESGEAEGSKLTGKKEK